MATRNADGVNLLCGNTKNLCGKMEFHDEERNSFFRWEDPVFSQKVERQVWEKIDNKLLVIGFSEWKKQAVGTTL